MEIPTTPSIAACVGISPRVCSRGARHGCRSVQRQARDGLSLDPDAGEKRRAPSYRASSLSDKRAQFPGGGAFWLLFGAAAKK